MSDSIFEIEHHPDGGVVLRIKSPKSWKLSDSTMQHLSAAQKEILLALRGAIDKAIEVTEEFERPKTKKKTKINIQ